MKYKLSVKYIFVFLFLCITFSVKAQNDAYYSTINPLNGTFISDLKTRVRIPYLKIDYDYFDETNINNFSSFRNGATQRYVVCIYSSYQYNYTPPFLYTQGSYGFSREHTWCQSWMPYVTESKDQYQDQHHIFPVEQNDANAVRNNHPLGIVTNVSSTFWDFKYGTNSTGDDVGEPRNQHKGDAARALLYMTIRYDGVDSYTWNFNWLNGTKLPELNEGEQDLNLLLQWHKQDPPDKWEVDRNNFIHYNQLNRNPFVDHPEYVNYINFNDLTLLSPAPVYSTEPSSYPSNFSLVNNGTSITLNWTVASGSPNGYLVEAYNTDNYFIPIDGEVYANDNNLADGNGVLIVSNPLNTCTFINTNSSNNYYFRIYSFNGSGTSINYKVDGNTVPNITTFSPGVSNTSLLDNFTRSDNTNIGSTPTSPTSLTWSKIETESNSSIRILSNSLRAGSTISGRDMAYLNISGLNSYPSILKNASGKLTWAMNMRQTNTSPSGFANGETGLAFILCTSSSNLNVDTGYAVVLGQSGTVDALRLISFAGGLNNNSSQKLTNIISAGDYSNEYLSVKVTYEPINEKWEMFVESNTSSYPQANPLNTSTKAGNTVISSGFTSFSLPVLGLMFNHGTASNYAYFDDIYISDPEGSLPVTLSYFASSVAYRNIKLNWVTESEINNAGFFLERAEVRNQNLEFSNIGYINGQGTKSTPTNYSYEDKNLNTGKYKYRLKQVDVNGNYEYFELSGEVEIGVPKKFDLSQNYPNPFNPVTKINFDLPVDSRVSILIYDVTGREVARVLNNEFKKAGYYTTEFKAGGLSSGVYFYVLNTENFRAAKKLVVLK